MVEGLRILLADSNADILKFVAGMLRKMRVGEVVPVDSGSRAVEAIKTSPKPFDCILADVDMPQGSGLQLLHAIRTGAVAGARPTMCVVLMLTEATPKVAQAAKQLDVNGVIMKPFRPEALEEAIAKARRRVFPLDMQRYAMVDPALLG
jgi:two-component system chemotaxis response regulator CheY